MSETIRQQAMRQWCVSPPVSTSILHTQITYSLDRANTANIFAKFWPRRIFALANMPTQGIYNPPIRYCVFSILSTSAKWLSWRFSIIPGILKLSGYPDMMSRILHHVSQSARQQHVHTARWVYEKTNNISRSQLSTGGSPIPAEGSHPGSHDLRFLLLYTVYVALLHTHQILVPHNWTVSRLRLVRSFRRSSEAKRQQQSLR